MAVEMWRPDGVLGAPGGKMLVLVTAASSSFRLRAEASPAAGVPRICMSAGPGEVLQVVDLLFATVLLCGLSTAGGVRRWLPRN